MHDLTERFEFKLVALPAAGTGKAEEVEKKLSEISSGGWEYVGASGGWVIFRKQLEMRGEQREARR